MNRKTQIKVILLIIVFIGLIAFTALGPSDLFTTKALWCLGIWLLLGLFAQQESSHQKQ